MNPSVRSKVALGGAAALVLVGAVIVLSREDHSMQPVRQSVPDGGPADADPDAYAMESDASETPTPPKDAAEVTFEVSDAARDPRPFERVLVPSFEIARGVDARVRPVLAVSGASLGCDGGDCDGGPLQGSYLVGFASDKGLPLVGGIEIDARGKIRTTTVPIAYRPDVARFGTEPPADVVRSIERVSPREVVTVDGQLRARVLLDARDVGPNERFEQCGRADGAPVVRPDAGAAVVTACHTIVDGQGHTVEWTETQTAGDAGAVTLGLARGQLEPPSSYRDSFAKVLPTKDGPRFFAGDETFVRGSFVHRLDTFASPKEVTFGFSRGVTGAAHGGGRLWVSTVGSAEVESVEGEPGEEKKGVISLSGRAPPCTVLSRKVLGSFWVAGFTSVVVLREVCDKSSQVVGFADRASYASRRLVDSTVDFDASAELPLPGGTVEADFLRLEHTNLVADASSKEEKPVLAVYVVKEGAVFVLRGTILRPD